jgi:hypothetical protein
MTPAEEGAAAAIAGAQRMAPKRLDAMRAIEWLMGYDAQNAKRESAVERLAQVRERPELMLNQSSQVARDLLADAILEIHAGYPLKKCVTACAAFPHCGCTVAALSDLRAAMASDMVAACQRQTTTGAIKKARGE